MTIEECPGKNQARDEADIWRRAVERYQSIVVIVDQWHRMHMHCCIATSAMSITTNSIHYAYLL